MSSPIRVVSRVSLRRSIDCDIRGGMEEEQGDTLGHVRESHSSSPPFPRETEQRRQKTGGKIPRTENVNF